MELLLLSTRNRFSWAQALAYRSKAGRGLSPGFTGWWAWSISKFTQIPTLGSTNGLGFMLGGGLDFKLQPRLVWRLQADYLGTDFQSSLQSNYSVGTGIIFRF